MIHPFVVRFERVLAQHGALCVIVEFQVNPVDGVIAAAFLGAFDELAPQSGTGGLGCGVDGIGDVLVGHDPFDQVAPLQLVEHRTVPADVVVLKIDQRHFGCPHRELMALPVGVDQVELGDPVEFAFEAERIAFDAGHHVFPHGERLLFLRGHVV